jgi:uncharacterized repeat protein (TIGR03837 family)
MPASRPQLPRTWDIFCRVIDNFGDIGVCWRLSRALAARGQRVRLWVDDDAALQWMAPEPCANVEVMAWHAAQPHAGLHTPGDVVIEAFGCTIPEDWIAIKSIAGDAHSVWANRPFSSKNPANSSAQPVWINLEYLSAEPYVERSHGLPSPVMSGPAKGMTKWFFYPGFTAKTGGLLREPLMPTVSAPSPIASERSPKNPALRISLFCYEPPALTGLIEQLLSTEQATELLVTAGRAQRALASSWSTVQSKNGHEPIQHARHQLSIQEQSWLTQDGYDELLMRCDLNFVRGEDSLVRAIWAGEAFVWNIYPQDDGAHIAKLHAFLDWLQAPPDLREFHDIWNGITTGALPALTRERLARWRACVQAAREKLGLQTDLVTQLLDFVEKKANSP